MVFYRELTEDKPTPSFWSSLCCCALIPSCRYAQHITQLTVLSAAGLEKQDRVGGEKPVVSVWHLRVYIYLYIYIYI